MLLWAILARIPNLKFISTDSHNSPDKASFGAKIKSLLKSDLFSFYATLSVVFLLIIAKSVSNEGQVSFFNDILKKYIEETSASAVSIYQSPQQMADINSLMALSYNSWGQGGQEADIALSTSQDNSFIANNPASTDYIETSGYKRSQVVEYTVQPGDAISFIASDYGVSVNSILWANNLSNGDNLKVGQTLRIPPVSGVIHKVKKGDTLATIAKKYGVEPEKISEFNVLSQNGELQIDDELIVPNGQIKTAVRYATSTSAKAATSRFSYLPNLGDYFFLPASGFNWGRIHGRNGVDVANSCGSPIYASADGSIAISDPSGWNGGFGKYIKIIHLNGTETIYAHLSKVLVSVGQVVGRGQLIGNMGTTGRSTGCHLHFEVHGARNPLAKY